MVRILTVIRIILFQIPIIFLFSGFAHSQEMNPAQIMDKYGNAVVLIATFTNNQEVGQGSGFIVRNDGVIVTNYHVIEHAYPALIKLKNGDVYEDVGVIAYNEREDFAVIKIKGFDLPAVHLGNSNGIKIGEKIVVIGNPNGLENTISDGLLSQIRDTGKGYKLHQISAPISPGSSGSPVFNSKGEVISIASSGFSAEYGQNLNFAIPINYVRAMIDGEVKHSLKEFSGVEKEKAIVKSNAKKEEVDVKKMLKILNEALSVLCMSTERVPVYYNIASGTNSTFIPNEFYDIRERLEIVTEKIYNYVSGDKELNEMRSKISENLEDVYNNMKKMMTAFEKRVVDPTRQEYAFEIREAGMRIARSLRVDPEFLLKFVERIRKDAPDVEKEMYYAFIFAYDNKEKGEAEKQKERMGRGVLGCEPYMFSEILQCKDIIKGSPADKAGMRINDKIFGIEKGVRFSSMKEYYDFHDKTSPGEVYTFKIKRNEEVLTKKIKLGKYENYF